MKTYLTTLIVFCYSITLLSNNIRGRVISSDEQPIEGAGIYNSITGRYTYTDSRGNFSLDGISVNDVLYVYSIGFETKEFLVGPDLLKEELTIEMQEAAVSLDQVVLVAKQDVAHTLVNIDLQTQPVRSSQEILRKVPGLVIGQHAGGGKAEQIFLRGFDADHGTDVLLQVDGLPVNLVSHAHGQGYADLHFLIPETIDNIDYGKGPYQADKGNFNTAGYVHFRTKNKLDQNRIAFETGQNNWLRTMGMVQLIDTEAHHAYLASEFVLNDGYFDSPQHFNRANIYGRYHYDNQEGQQFNLSLSHFTSGWTASGQIPQRAVDSGRIGRYGAIDDTEGGDTGRTNIWVEHSRKNGSSEIITSGFLSAYSFDLFSNFTFFLEDPENGDQIRQREKRLLMGMETRYRKEVELDNSDDLQYQAGMSIRYDAIEDVSLSHTKDRYELLQRLVYGDVKETNIALFSDLTYRTGKWTLRPGLRLDMLNFNYQDQLTPFAAESTQKLIPLPKLHIKYTASPYIQYMLKAGVGFHSNDSRLSANDSGRNTLPAALGTDLGLVLRPWDRFVVNTTLWGLWLEQEFVYVGDAGIVEPSGSTRRVGAELGLRYQISDWLYLYSDLNYAHARSSETAGNDNYIPLAPSITASGGLSVKNFRNFSGGLQYRYVGDRPATEDRSLVAGGYFITDLNLNYTIGKWTLGFQVENLFDRKWEETQFATLSRLQDEAVGVEEIHFTPGSPLQCRASLELQF